MKNIQRTTATKPMPGPEKATFEILENSVAFLFMLAHLPTCLEPT